jgi:hypothetical protein
VTVETISRPGLVGVRSDARRFAPIRAAPCGSVRLRRGSVRERCQHLLGLLDLEAGSAGGHDRAQVAPRLGRVAHARVRPAALEPRRREIGLERERPAVRGDGLAAIAAVDPTSAIASAASR